MLVQLLNRVPARTRTGLGAVFGVAGIAPAAVSEAVAAGRRIHAATFAVVGAVLGARRAARRYPRGTTRRIVPGRLAQWQ